MKITDVKTFLVHDRERPKRNYTFVKIYTDEGLTGLGEAGINGKELALKGLVETYRPILIGMDPARIEHIWQTLWRGQFFRGGHVHSATVAAVDLALWDLRGKALGVPVYDLLGGQTRDYARCYCHVQRPHGQDGRRAGIDEMVANGAKAQVAAGWRFVRFGVPAKAEPRWTTACPRAVSCAALDGGGLRRAARRAGPRDRNMRGPPSADDADVRHPDGGRVGPDAPIFHRGPSKSGERGRICLSAVPYFGTRSLLGEQLASKWEWQVLIEQRPARLLPRRPLHLRGADGGSQACRLV